jgi:hypothetical protein
VYVYLTDQTVLFSNAFHSQIRSSETCGDPANAVPFYRSYNGAVVDHWYTSKVAEIIVYNPQGYGLQGVTGLVFVTQEPGTTPFYGLYSASNTDHFYTISLDEKATVEKEGYTNYSVSYIYPMQVCGSIPLFRMYGVSQGDHFYTTSDAEHVSVIANNRYLDQGIAGYILPVGCT